jgi:predicted nucleic acid-binding protein
LKVVFDSNIPISAPVFPGGRAVRPRRHLEVLKDAPDKRVLECAVSARADANITGDKALLALGRYRGVRIAGLRDYLAE